ncbi:uncharacterized protein [Littorina saxatilis]|uniref:uncharacterized protein n=1 Tax=Littorina saxatilis TaxID=31220 RepID=UPI0038B58DFA
MTRKIKDFNSRLKALCNTEQVTFLSLQLIWKVDENGCLDSQILADSVHYSPKGLSLFLREVKSALWERQQNPVASYAAAVKGQRMSSPQTSPHDIGETSQSTQQPLSPRSQHPPMSQQPPQGAVTLHSPQQQYETVQPCHRPQHQCVPDQHGHRPQHQYVPEQPSHRPQHHYVTEQPSQPPRSTEATALAPGGTQPPHHRWFHPFPVLDPSGYFHAPPGPHSHFHQSHYPPHLLHPSMYSAFSPFVQQAPPPFYSQWPMPQATM